MKALRVIGTAIVLTVLCAAIVLTLAAGGVRFLALNPQYLIAFVPTRSYCEQLREDLADDLDHVALLYGLDPGELSDVVTDESLRDYTADLIEALFDADASDELELPSYSARPFARYLRKQRTEYSEQAIEDFSEDCAAAVTEALTAINATPLVQLFITFRDSRLADSALLLFIGGAILTLLMCVILRLMYLGSARRAGSVVLWGGCFMGVTLVFVPVMQFLLFDYIGRLNITASAFRTILTGLLYTTLYGFFIALSALQFVFTLLLLIAIIRASRRKGKKA